jgi:hypothetical protein
MRAMVAVFVVLGACTPARPAERAGLAPFMPAP